MGLTKEEKAAAKLAKKEEKAKKAEEKRLAKLAKKEEKRLAKLAKKEAKAAKRAAGGGGGGGLCCCCGRKKSARVLIDTDGDGIPDAIDLDGDGIPDEPITGPVDLDGDGIPDYYPDPPPQAASIPFGLEGVAPPTQVGQIIQIPDGRFFVSVMDDTLRALKWTPAAIVAPAPKGKKKKSYV